MSWLDPLVYAAYNVILYAGVAVTRRRNLNFVGSAVTVADNPTTESTDVTINTTGLTWAEITSSGLAFIKTIPGVFGTVRVGIADKDPAVSAIGKPILFTGQDVSGASSVGGAVTVAGSVGQEGGFLTLAGGSATNLGGKAGDVSLEGGGFLGGSPTGGSTGGSVYINATNGATKGHVSLRINGTEAIGITAGGNVAVTPVNLEAHDTSAGTGSYSWTIGGVAGMSFANDGFRIGYVDGSELPLLQALGGGGLIADSDTTKLQWTAGGETVLVGTGIRVEGGSTGITFDGGTPACLDANGFSAAYNGDTKNLTADVNGVTCTASAYTLVPSLATITRTTKASGKIEVDFTVNGVPVTTACQLAVFVDGVITSPPIQGQLGLGLGVITSSMKGLITGLSAAAHTIDLRYKNGAGGTLFIRPAGTSGATGEQACLDAKVVSA